MKKLKRWLSEVFNPENFNDLDIAAIAGAMNDPTVRTRWLSNMLDELKLMNMNVDRRLLSDSQIGLNELCSRRKAFQDVLESILAARRQTTQDERPNPRFQGVNLDRVTA